MRFGFCIAIILSCLVSTTRAAQLVGIQKGTTTFPAGSGTHTQAITAVDLDSSIFFFTMQVADNAPGDFQISGHLSASNLLSFSRQNVGGSPAVTIEWQVLTFTGGVYVQRGTATNVGGGGVNVTISAVDLSESFAIVNMHKDGGQYGSDDGVTADLTTTTNLYVDREAGGGVIQFARWQVVEWEGANVQKLNSVLLNGVDSLAVTLSTSVNRSKSMVISNHQLDGDINADDIACTELIDNNTVTFTRTGTTRDLTFVAYVIEFTDSTDVVHGSIRMLASETDISTTICTVDDDSAIVVNGSNFGRASTNCLNTDDNMGVAWASLVLSDGTTVRARRPTSGAAGVWPFQVVEFTRAIPSGCVPTEPGASTPRTSTGGLCSTTLPIELVDFSVANKSSKVVELNWETATERDNDYFELMRSSNGTDWNVIGRVEGLGNRHSTSFYRYFDKQPIPLAYYRIVQYDYDGDAEFFGPLLVDQRGEGKDHLKIFPNPTSQGTATIYLGQDLEHGVLSIYTTQGELVYNRDNVSSEHTLPEGTLKTGTYLVKLNNGFVVKHQRMIVL